MAGELTDWISAAGALFSAGAAVAAWRAVVESNRLTKAVHEKYEIDAFFNLQERFHVEVSRLRSRIALASEVINDLHQEIIVSEGKRGALGFVDAALERYGVKGFRETIDSALKHLGAEVESVSEEPSSDALRHAVWQVMCCTAPVEAVIERVRDVRGSFRRS